MSDAKAEESNKIINKELTATKKRINEIEGIMKKKAKDLEEVERKVLDTVLKEYPKGLEILQKANKIIDKERKAHPELDRIKESIKTELLNQSEKLHRVDTDNFGQSLAVAFGTFYQGMETLLKTSRAKANKELEKEFESFFKSVEQEGKKLEKSGINFDGKSPSDSKSKPSGYGAAFKGTKACFSGFAAKVLMPTELSDDTKPGLAKLLKTHTEKLLGRLKKTNNNIQKKSKNKPDIQPVTKDNKSKLDEKSKDIKNTPKEKMNYATADALISILDMVDNSHAAIQQAGGNKELERDLENYLAKAEKDTKKLESKIEGIKDGKKKGKK